MALGDISRPIGSKKQPVAPMAIFDTLKLNPPIENIYGPQVDALEKWDKCREKNDVVIEMNTGGGKTLVGLLIAQSLLNELKGEVYYVCSTNHLIEQTKTRAAELSLSVATYSKGSWDNQAEFDLGKVFCVTNYHSLLNGKSKFKSNEISAVIFDDAHVSESIIRDQFTLKVPSNSVAYRKILEKFGPHFRNSSLITSYREAMSGKPTPVIYVPSFVFHQTNSQMYDLLRKDDLVVNGEGKFAFQNIKNRFEVCSCLFDHTRIEITPSMLPLRSSNLFQEDVRRVYLTATLPSPSAAVRVFGDLSHHVVHPKGRCGDAQRLVVYVPGETDEEQINNAIELSKNYRSCVISPTHKAAEKWDGHVCNSGQDIEKEIELFSKSEEVSRLSLIARYDGVDLPGNVCNMLILDRMPYGGDLFNQFLDRSLKSERTRTESEATRITQAIGRIFRSNTDHGVVLVVGRELQSWLRKPKNRQYLPARLQQQLQLSDHLVKQIEIGATTWTELIEGVINSDPVWDKLYSDIDEFDVDNRAKSDASHLEIISLEKQAYNDLWDGHYASANDKYSQAADKAEVTDKELEAWYRHMRGLCNTLRNKHTDAFQQYHKAVSIRSALGLPSTSLAKQVTQDCSPSKYHKQISGIKKYYLKHKSKLQNIFAAIDAKLEYDPGADDAKPAEWSVHELGRILGLDTSRPDNSGKKTGPDVVWALELDEVVEACGFELKTNKEEGGVYAKSESGQCHEHKSWMSNEYGIEEFYLAIIGRHLEVDEKASPYEKLEVINLEEFKGLFQNVKDMYGYLSESDSLDQDIAVWIKHLRLTYPKCVTSMNSVCAVDLQSRD